MRILLDTHILLWWLSDDARLSAGLRSQIMNSDNEVLVSAVTIAEISIKRSLGKLSAPRELLTLLAESGMTELPLSSQHAERLAELPQHHRDPFDRMIVAQALVEGVPLATNDVRLAAYDIQTISA